MSAESTIKLPGGFYLDGEMHLIRTSDGETAGHVLYKHVPAFAAAMNADGAEVARLRNQAEVSSRYAQAKLARLRRELDEARALDEPTEAMCDAGYDATRGRDGLPPEGFCLGHAAQVYRAMRKAGLSEVRTLASRQPASTAQAEGWRPISTVEHADGVQVWLRATGARTAVWEWSERNQRWERADGLHWAEGEYGPEQWMSVGPPALAHQKLARVSWDERMRRATAIVHGADGRGMIGRDRRHLVERVARSCSDLPTQPEPAQ